MTALPSGARTCIISRCADRRPPQSWIRDRGRWILNCPRIFESAPTAPYTQWYSVCRIVFESLPLIRISVRRRALVTRDLRRRALGLARGGANTVNVLCLSPDTSAARLLVPHVRRPCRDGSARTATPDAKNEGCRTRGSKWGSAAASSDSCRTHASDRTGWPDRRPDF